MPPLRERTEDLPMLIDDLILMQERHGQRGMRLAPDAVHTLRQYHWPGNVRELANLIERLAVLHPGKLVDAASLPPRYRSGTAETVNVPAAPVVEPLEPISARVEVNEPLRFASPMLPAQALAELPPEGLSLKDHIESIELSLIRQALQQAGGVVAHAAKLLNTRRTTLVEKLRKYGLTREAGGLELEPTTF